MKIKRSVMSYRVIFFFWTPPNLTKSLALYKFVYLDKFFWGGQFKLYRAWDLVKLGGVQKEKKLPCMMIQNFSMEMLVVVSFKNGNSGGSLS